MVFLYKSVKLRISWWFKNAKVKLSLYCKNAYYFQFGDKYE